MRKRTIALILWCVLVAGCFVAARSYLSAVLLTGTVTVVVFCAVSVKKSRTALSVSLDLPKCIRQGKKKSGKLTLTDSSAFPLFRVTGTICCSWEPDGEAAPEAETTPETDIQPDGDATPGAGISPDDSAAQTFSCTVPAYRKEEITVKLNSARAGVVHVWLKELTVCDLLGIFRYQADVSAVRAAVTVTPVPQQEAAADAEETPQQETAADAKETPQQETAADEKETPQQEAAADAEETPQQEAAADAEKKQEKSDE